MRVTFCKPDNYRGISLFNVICKVFDLVISVTIFIYTSEIQFGLKQNHYTVLCSLPYKEVIYNY